MLLESSLTILLLGLAVLAAQRHHVELRAGALWAASITSLATAASALEWLPWEEGGWGMHALTILGAASLGLAGASRVNAQASLRTMALAGAVATLLASGALYGQALGVVNEVVRNAAVGVQDVIRAAGQAEIIRLPQLALGLALLTVVVAFTPRSSRPVVA